MSDRIVVMSDAEVQQVGTPGQVYYDPANLFVARFIGSPGMNLVPGRLEGDAVRIPGADNRVPLPLAYRQSVPAALAAAGSDQVTIGFRPEATTVSAAGGLVGEVYAVDMPMWVSYRPNWRYIRNRGIVTTTAGNMRVLRIKNIRSPLPGISKRLKA